MKKLFLALTFTLISSPITLFGMEMEQPACATQEEMVTIEITNETGAKQQFEIERKYAELSGTIKNSTQMTKLIDEAINDSSKKENIPIDSRTIHLPGITPEQWQLIAPLFESVYQISLAPDVQEKKEREQNLALNDKTDDKLSAIINGADFLEIEPLL